MLLHRRILHREDLLGNLLGGDPGEIGLVGRQPDQILPPGPGVPGLDVRRFDIFLRGPHAGKAQQDPFLPLERRGADAGHRHPPGQKELAVVRRGVPPRKQKKGQFFGAHHVGLGIPGFVDGKGHQGLFFHIAQGGSLKDEPRPLGSLFTGNGSHRHPAPVVHIGLDVVLDLDALSLLHHGIGPRLLHHRGNLPGHQPKGLRRLALRRHAEKDQAPYRHQRREHPAFFHWNHSSDHRWAPPPGARRRSTPSRHHHTAERQRRQKDHRKKVVPEEQKKLHGHGEGGLP